MTQPISGRDMMPKSLEVSRLQQLRAVSENQDQQQLAVKQQKEQTDSQKQVTKSNHSEGSRIRSDQESQKKKRSFQQRKKLKNEEDEKEEEKLLTNKRGHIIDFRV